MGRPLAQLGRRGVSEADAKARVRRAAFDGGAVVRLLSRVTIGALLVAVPLLFLVPYAWMLSSSFKTQLAIFADLTPLSVWTFLPRAPSLVNFAEMFGPHKLGRALVNSGLVAGLQVAGTLVVCSLGAYGFSRLHFPGKRVLFILVLVPFMVPFEALLVPLYQVVSGLHLSDNYAGVVLPFVASPFGLFLLRQAFDEIPRELDEAATLDGARSFQVYWHIILPSARTPLATLALLTFLWSWNAFLWPLVILQSPDLQVVQVTIAEVAAPDQVTNWAMIFAGATIATAPVLVLFVFLQRFFVRGIATTGLK